MTDQVAPSPQSLCDHPVYVHHVRGGEPLTIPVCQLCGEIGWDDLREQVADHRRMVLDEAADELTSEIEWQREKYGDGSSKVGIGRLIGMEDAQATLRRLAAAAPPDGLSAPVPAGAAPAVPDATAYPFVELGRQAIESCRTFTDALAEAYGPSIAAIGRTLSPTMPDDARAAAVDALPDVGTDQTEGEKPWPGLPTPGLHLVTVEDMNTCVRCGKFTGRADCPGDTAPEGADERNGHG